MKVGIFAGTFDPIHNGHIIFAKKAIDDAGLSKVIIVAEKEPYRKKPYASWDHRQAMIERATQDLNEVDHDYAFANKLAHQHTLNDTLAVAKNHWLDSEEIWFLVGSDIFEHTAKWQNLALAHEYGGFVVALRADQTESWVKEQVKKMAKNFQPKNLIILKDSSKISSSKVRDLISADEDISNLVSDNVAMYIKEHELYKTDYSGSSE